MISLFQFQEEAAATIADRFLEYLEDPPQAGTRRNPHTVPFFQALSALTGAGKTVILASAVSQVGSTMPVAPVVIWLSRGKVVVQQSLANLSDGGKYHELLDNTQVITLGDFDPLDATDSSRALLCFATVGTFNQKDKEEGSLTIFQSEIDTTETSTWDALKVRANNDGIRRPLIVVYDEGHNLSDQQTELLLELEPDGFVLASATMKLPARLAREYEALRRAGWSDDQLITQVDTTDVVKSGLVKGTINLAGYNAPMEETISNLLDDMAQATSEAEALSQPFRPKAMYVCNTNMMADNAFQSDDPKQPFGQRQAPPILIWRYLVDQCGVDPSTIAVYADLKTHKDYPLPEDFTLYKGGDKDYELFTGGDYTHIIFNLSLQEGWDDPAVYFAYVDKSMDSRVQVTQVIGRVLRQPNATRYTADRLNTAHFYVRVDRNETFNGVVDEVRKQLGHGPGAIRIIATPPGKPKPIEYPPLKALEVPMTALFGDDAQSPIQEVLDGFPDFRADNVNTKGEGSRRISRQRIGDASDDSGWETFEQASRVSARWVFHREVQRRYKRALDVINLAEPKLNAVIGFGSAAYLQVRDLAEKVVKQYIEDVRLGQRGPNPYRPGAILARPEEVVTFKNAVHEGYSGLNSLELPFAHALDGTGLDWARNPSRNGYGIPLVSMGDTDNFYPDFLVWTSRRVICIDTKGGFLVRETAGRKLLNIKPKAGAERFIDVQFVTEGRWNVELLKEAPDGHTQWGLNDEGRLKVKHFDSLDKLVASLTAEKADD